MASFSEPMTTLSSTPRPAIYSGPHRSGICTCGHSWEDHHLNMIMTEAQMMTDSELEGYVPGECEYYGANEMGGLGPDGEYHCGSYKDSNA